jgi:hypothetical protein
LQDTEKKPNRKGQKNGRKLKPAVVIPTSEELNSTGETKRADQNELTTRRKPASINVHWSADDKSPMTFVTLGLFANGSPFCYHQIHSSSFSLNTGTISSG